MIPIAEKTAGGFNRNLASFTRRSGTAEGSMLQSRICDCACAPSSSGFSGGSEQGSRIGTRGENGKGVN